MNSARVASENGSCENVHVIYIKWNIFQCDIHVSKSPLHSNHRDFTITNDVSISFFPAPCLIVFSRALLIIYSYYMQVNISIISPLCQSKFKRGVLFILFILNLVNVKAQLHQIECVIHQNHLFATVHSCIVGSLYIGSVNWFCALHKIATIVCTSTALIQIQFNSIRWTSYILCCLHFVRVNIFFTCAY